MKKLVSFLLTFTMILSGAAMAYADEDLNSYTLDEIVEKAQEEGHVESVGMPDSWANWGDSWKGLTDTYGIEHSDEDMSSAEELSMFQNDSTRDIGDVGLAFTQQAIDNDLVQGYKTSYWDSVPDWAKGEDGKWMIAYTGATTFLSNKTLLDKDSQTVPESWDDIKNGTYKVAIGDINGGNAQAAVIASNFALCGNSFFSHTMASSHASLSGIFQTRIPFFNSPPPRMIGGSFPRLLIGNSPDSFSLLFLPVFSPGAAGILFHSPRKRPSGSG